MDCPTCGNGNTVFFEVAQAPVFCNCLCDSREQALAAPRADIRLAFCPQCELIYNQAFDPRLVNYAPNYENSLHFSPRFQQYAQGLAQQLVERCDLRGKDIIEIGCGRGDFLRLLCGLGGNRGTGFDPSYKLNGDPPDPAVRILSEPYSPAHAHVPVDFLCCRHVLEHIPTPRDFLAQTHAALAGRPRTQVFFEVPNACHTLNGQGIWDIIYEHCCYFTPNSLGRTFQAAGYDVADVAEAYEGQFLNIHALVENAPALDTGAPPVPPTAGAGIEQARGFAQAYKTQVEYWRLRISRLADDGRRTAIWGGGSKGVTFLNTLGISDSQAPYVVDLNPRKHGRFVPGTAQKIVGPEFLREYRPQVILIMNPIYVNEIRRQVQALGLHCRFFVA